MSKNLGIKELAKLADVSIGTVDRVLHNREGVSLETKEKVLKIVKETGYKKNVMASRLKLASIKEIKIAVLVPEVDNLSSYWKLPLQGITTAVEELSELGISTDYFYFDLLNPDAFKNKTDLILEMEFDALVTVPFFGVESESLLERSKKRNLPVVFLDTERDLKDSGNFIRQNSYNAGRVAARLLHGLVGDDGLYFVINILNERGKQINNFQRENGFRSYFEKDLQKGNIQLYVINHPMKDELELTPDIIELLKSNAKKGLFITNARSFLIPGLIQKYDINKTKIVGFDLNRHNVKFLKNGEIDFLINQKPEYQGYAAIKGIYKFLTEKDNSQLNIDIPIEIVVKENVDYYEGNLYR